MGPNPNSNTILVAATYTKKVFTIDLQGNLLNTITLPVEPQCFTSGDLTHDHAVLTRFSQTAAPTLCFSLPQANLYRLSCMQYHQVVKFSLTRNTSVEAKTLCLDWTCLRTISQLSFSTCFVLLSLLLQEEAQQCLR